MFLWMQDLSIEDIAVRPTGLMAVKGETLVVVAPVPFFKIDTREVVNMEFFEEFNVIRDEVNLPAAGVTLVAKARAAERYIFRYPKIFSKPQPKCENEESSGSCSAINTTSAGNTTV